jgi:hypothetical protein|tara:strand:+ start:2787 stop:3785 length:999 start_codon:yes stop_codon:yes gene_type:complete
MNKFPLLFSVAMSLPLLAETVYTIPQGYTEVTIAGASSAGETKLSAISATLLQDVAYSGAVTIGAYTDSQAASVAGASWTATQWTDEPHLAYLSVAANAAEKAFLILGNTTSGGLTLAAESDLLVNFQASSTIKIRKANTLSSIFSSGASDITGADRFYIWDNGKEGGPGWSNFFYSSAGGGNWVNVTAGSLANDMVVYPDEGIFVQRAVTTDIKLKLFGEVPSVPQVASIEGTGFLSSRVPVNTELQNLGIQGASWETGDRVYIWNADGGVWQAHRYTDLGGGFWIKILTNTVSSTQIITPSSAVFVVRESETAAGNGEITTTLPYDLTAE